MTLFEKYGGFTTVSNIVRQFYKDLTSSPNLRPYFEHINMESLIDHQTKFISHALGGPAEYTGRTLAKSHKGLSITNAHFDEVADILQDVLEDAGVEAEDVTAIMGVISSTRSAIVEGD